MKRILASSALLLVANTLMAQVGWFNALTAQYPLDGSAVDIIPTAINGTTSGPTAIADRHGVSNQAYRFLGTTATTNQISITTAPGSKLKGQTHTISCWVKINSNTSASEGGYPHMLILHSKNTNPGATSAYHDSYGLYYNKTQRRFFTLTNYYNSLTGSPFNEKFVMTTNTVDTNKWYFLTTAFAYDSLYFYLDGVRQGAVAKGYNLVYDNRPISIGRTNVSGVEGYLNGDLDDIRYYNRVLTPCEIQTLYITELNLYEVGVGRPAGESPTLNSNGYIYNIRRIQDSLGVRSNLELNDFALDEKAVKNVIVSDISGKIILKKSFDLFRKKDFQNDLENLNVNSMVIISYYDGNGNKLKTEKKPVIR